jgi:predicted permease
MFSRIVPSLTPQNIGSLAPLTVIGLFYGIVGAAMAWIIRLCFWVPHRFRYGILAAGGWGNWGDIRMCTVSLTRCLSRLKVSLRFSDGHCDGNYGVCSVQRHR